jgi:ABC-type Fe3+/spermidine/putrescine transport system ATPase subunit
MLLDEPLGSLDPHLRSEMQVEIRLLQKVVGITTIMVTHDQQEAMIMGDRIAVLHEGTLRQLDTPQDIYERPASAFVARFIGDANVFALEGLTGRGDRIELKASNGLTIVSLDTTVAGSAGRLAAVVRPEAVKIGPRAESLENRFRGRVLWMTYLGSQMRCRLAIGEMAEITTVVPRDDVPVGTAAGDETWIGWSAAATRVVPEG